MFKKTNLFLLAPMLLLTHTPSKTIDFGNFTNSGKMSLSNCTFHCDSFTQSGTFTGKNCNIKIKNSLTITHTDSELTISFDNEPDMHSDRAKWTIATGNNNHKWQEGTIPEPENKNRADYQKQPFLNILLPEDPTRGIPTQYHNNIEKFYKDLLNNVFTIDYPASLSTKNKNVFVAHIFYFSNNIIIKAKNGEYFDQEDYLIQIKDIDDETIKPDVIIIKDKKTKEMFDAAFNLSGDSKITIAGIEIIFE